MQKNSPIYNKMIQENNNTNLNKKDSIDIIDLLKEFWGERKIILKITVAFAFLGLFVVIFSKNEFTTSTTFVPSTGGSSVSGSLGSLASLAGINIGAGSNSMDISPELYPQIVNSTPFQLEILNMSIRIKGQAQPISYKDFYENIYSPGLLANIKKYTLSIPYALLSMVRPNEETIEVDTAQQENKIIRVSQKENKFINQLDRQVRLAVNLKEGFVSISVTFPEAIASAQIALKVQQLLQSYVLQFKTQKSIEQLNYIEERYLEKQNEFNKIKIDLARLQDQNSSINTALGRLKLVELQSDYDLTFSVYSGLSKQLEKQRLQVKQNTPLFMILKPVTIPNHRAGPKRGLILGLYLFLGFVLSMGYVFAKRFLTRFKNK